MPRKYADHDAKTADLEGFIREFRGESDRAAAIVGAAFLDAQLEQLIKGFLIDDQQEVNKLFDSGQGLGTFDTKIRIAYCLGLIVKMEYEDIQIIQRVRNRFGHRLHGLSFNDQSIIDQLHNLQLPKHMPVIAMFPVATPSPRDLFVFTVCSLAAIFNTRTPVIATERRKGWTGSYGVIFTDLDSPIVKELAAHFQQVGCWPREAALTSARYLMGRAQHHYHDAGAPYGDTDEGLLRWLKKQDEPLDQQERAGSDSCIANNN